MAVQQITVQDLAALGGDIVLIDVREADEWEQVRVPYALHIPLTTVPDHLESFTGDPSYVICKVGGRSQRACEFAEASGASVMNVAGGMLAWVDAGYPTESGR